MVLSDPFPRWPMINPVKYRQLPGPAWDMINRSPRKLPEIQITGFQVVGFQGCEIKLKRETTTGFRYRVRRGISFIFMTRISATIR